MGYDGECERLMFSIPLLDSSASDTVDQGKYGSNRVHQRLDKMDCPRQICYVVNVWIMGRSVASETRRGALKT